MSKPGSKNLKENAQNDVDGDGANMVSASAPCNQAHPAISASLSTSDAEFEQQLKSLFGNRKRDSG